ncbi:type I methionyl aminopeptidase [Timonella senegalensis]|uniref:type I methionyl aminopeptidase n=1 Tax=Timonella senegalensis TaxID=1465825 RepID=UPI0028A6C57D|nr:type I methionyl aminopeptidase [Timonella senegalensis]
MIEVMGPTEIKRARKTGALVGRILQSMKQRAVAGTNLLDIDAWTKAMIEEAGAVSCYVDYEPSFGEGPFAHYICTSVNEAVLHGKPYNYTLRKGDLLTLDLAVSLDGVVADAAISFVIGGEGTEEDRALIDATVRALEAGIAAVKPGNKIGDISYAIGQVLRGAGYAVNTDFGGHGVGSTMHQDPHIPNNGEAGRGFKLRPGLLLAIEPWVMTGTDELVTASDGWTLKSATGSRTAHTEHTVLVTADGAEILTLP